MINSKKVNESSFGHTDGKSCDSTWTSCGASGEPRSRKKAKSVPSLPILIAARAASINIIRKREGKGAHPPNRWLQMLAGTT